MNYNLLVEASGMLDGLIWMILGIMIGPAIILAIIGLGLKKTNKKAAKVFFILAVVYLIISFGVCGSLMLSY